MINNKLEPSDLKDIGLLKNYRIIRRWACRNNNLRDSDLELLVHFDCLEFFTKQDYKSGTYYYPWCGDRWNKLLKEGWIIVWRTRNRTTQKYNIYKLSFKCQQLISRMYRIMLGKEDIPTSHRNVIMKGDTYINRQMALSIKSANKKQN
jgi:hypothetical protein